MSKQKKKKVIHYEGKFRRFVNIGGWEFVERLQDGGIVVILPMTEKKDVILIKQFRPPIGKYIIEFPAGLVSDTKECEGETLAEAANRELIEETGYKAARLKKLTVGPSSAATCSDMLTFYRAYGLKKVGKGGGIDIEDITVHSVKLSKVDAWLTSKEREGCIVDPKVYAGLYFLMHK